MNTSFFITKCLSMSKWYRGYEWMLSKFLPCLFTNQQIVPRGFYVQHFIRSLCWDDEKCLHTHADVPNLRNAWLIYHSIWGVTSIRCCILRIVVKRIAQHKDLTMNFISLIRYVVIRIDWFQYFLNSNISCIFYENLDDKNIYLTFLKHKTSKKNWSDVYKANARLRNENIFFVIQNYFHYSSHLMNETSQI